MRDWFQASREHESMFMKTPLPLPVPSLSSLDKTQTVAPQGNRITLERGEGITAIEAEAILDSICARAKAQNSHEVYYPAVTGLLKFHLSQMIQDSPAHLERLLRDHGYSIQPTSTTESTPVSSSLSYPPPEPESLTLVVGEYYENRGGEVVGPIERSGCDAYPFKIHNEQGYSSWTANGQRLATEQGDTDLIRAVPAPDPVKVLRWSNWGPDNTMATKFNGEYVRYTDHLAALKQAGKGEA